jgi:hypothetical protein
MEKKENRPITNVSQELFTQFQQQFVTDVNNKRIEIMIERAVTLLSKHENEYILSKLRSDGARFALNLDDENDNDEISIEFRKLWQNYISENNSNKNLATQNITDIIRWSKDDLNNLKKYLYEQKNYEYTCAKSVKSSNIISIQQFFNNINTHWTSGIHVISIGCASNLDNTGSKEQQFFPFLQNFKKMYSKVPITLILIDPIMKQIPDCILKTGLKTPLKPFMSFEAPCIWDNIYNIKWKVESHINIFLNAEYNIKIFTFRESVCYSEDENYMINIKKYLRDYQSKIINDAGKSILFVHDFSGGNIISLANEMDTVLENNIKYVMYDITTRQNSIDVLDLTDEICNPVIKYEEIYQKKGILKKYSIINPFSIKTRCDESKIQLLWSRNKTILNEQLNMIKKNKIASWKNILCSIYTKLFNICQEEKLLSSSNKLHSCEHISKLDSYKHIMDERLKTQNRIIDLLCDIEKKANKFNNNVFDSKIHYYVNMFKTTNNLKHIQSLCDYVKLIILKELKYILNFCNSIEQSSELMIKYENIINDTTTIHTFSQSITIELENILNIE